MDRDGMISATIVDWLPIEWHQPLLMVKGLLAVVSVMMLIYHMNQRWAGIESTAQRARYYSLLAYAILVAGSSAEQVAEGMLLSYRHLGSILVTLGLVVAMVISIHECREKERLDKSRRGA